MNKQTEAPVPGAVDRGGGHVSFSLYAPGKDSVHLLGSFNDWDPSADALTPSSDGLWRLEKELEPGEYSYQYLLNGDLSLCDPNARSLTAGAEAESPRAVVRVGREAYHWNDGAWRRPSFRDLIIYELHVGTFSPERNFEGVRKRLHYLADFGVNCIELLPPYEFKGESGWGYNPSYFFSVESSYGDPDDLKQLIDESHKLGIAVIMDLVLAHSGKECPLLKMYPYEDSPWYGRGVGEENQFGFPMLDHSKPGTKRLVRDIQRFWLEQYHFDGFRYDYLHGIGIREDEGVPYLVKTAREVADDLYLIGEYSPELPEAVNSTGLSGAWHVGISYALKALIGEGRIMVEQWESFRDTFEQLDPAVHTYASPSMMVNYIESHDEERLILQLVGSGMDRETARKKSSLAASLLFLLAGPVMLYHGQEWGEDTPRTQEYNPLHWEFMETHSGRSLYDHYRRMAGIRSEHPAVRSDNFRISALYPEKKAAVIHRWNNAGNEIVAAFNFSRDEQTFRVPFPRAGIWKDLLSGKGMNIPDSMELTLGGSDAAVFTRS